MWYDCVLIIFSFSMIYFVSLIPMDAGVLGKFVWKMGRSTIIGIIIIMMKGMVATYWESFNEKRLFIAVKAFAITGKYFP